MRPPYDIPAPPGQLVYAAAASRYADRMRDIFQTQRHGSDTVIVSVDGPRHWVIIVPDLTILFTQVGHGVITVDPLLAVTDVPAPQPWPPANFVQAAIDATAAFLLEIASTEGVQ